MQHKFKTLSTALILGSTLIGGISMAQQPSATVIEIPAQTIQLTQEWDKTFPKSDLVEHRKVTFKNRYGVVLAGDLYIPKNRGTEKLPAIVLSGPFGAVKEQSSGLHAQEMAKRGFVTLAFDPSFTGESSGLVRDVASPDVFTEDFSAAVDFIGLQPEVNRERIGVLAICGLSGMAVTAAASDSRIKAVATTAMYDMSRSMSKGYQDSYIPEQRQKIINYLSQQRWQDAENGNYARGYHELAFDAQNNVVVVSDTRLFPDALPDEAPEIAKQFFDYYKTKRSYHPRSINSNTAWTATTPMAFFSFPMMSNIKDLHRPVLFVTGTKAHSRYYSEDAYKAANQPKELVVVEGATHVDLYDNLEKIPFDKFEAFFKANLK